MTAQVFPFPPRGPFTVYVVDDEDGWLVLCRSHGWVYSDQRERMPTPNMSRPHTALR